jgi:molecular chaperone HscB
MGVTCWSCQSPLTPSEPFCPSCGKLQPPEPGADHFAALGLPRAYDLDPELLEQRFRERSRRLHPDRFARAGVQERRFSLEQATRLNDAHRALRDHRRRASYLLELAGQGQQAAPQPDPAFLEEQLAARERLALARAAGDSRRAAAIAAEARRRLEEIEAELGRLFAEADPGVEALAAIGRCLVRARYWENLAEDAGRQ